MPVSSGAYSLGQERRRQLDAEAAANPYRTIEKVGGAGRGGRAGGGGGGGGASPVHRASAVKWAQACAAALAHQARMLATPPYSQRVHPTTASQDCLEAAAANPEARLAAKPALAQPKDPLGEE